MLLLISALLWAHAHATCERKHLNWLYTAAKYSEATERHAYYGTNTTSCDFGHAMHTENGYWTDSVLPEGSFNVQESLWGTHYVQRYVWELQHPVDCSKAKFLVIENTGAGIGASLYFVSRFAAIAIQLGRVFLVATTREHTFWHDDYCGDAPNWLQCYFLPESSCNLGDALQDGSHHYLDNDLQTDQSHLRTLYVRGNDAGNYTLDFVPSAFLDLFKRGPFDAEPKQPVGHISEYLDSFHLNHQLNQWFTAQMRSYLLRPNPRTTKAIQDTLHKLIKNGHHHHVDAKDIAVNGLTTIHIRRGNKGSEMEEFEPQVYLHRVQQMKETYTWMSGKVFLITESLETRKWFVEHVGADGLYYLDSPTYGDETVGSYEEHIERLPNGVATEAINTLAALQVGADTDAFVSSFPFSNVATLIEELRSTFRCKATSPMSSVMFAYHMNHDVIACGVVA